MQVNLNKVILCGLDSKFLPDGPQFTFNIQFVWLRLAEGGSNSISSGIFKSIHLYFPSGNDIPGKVSEHLEVSAFKSVTKFKDLLTVFVPEETG